MSDTGAHWRLEKYIGKTSHISFFLHYFIQKYDTEMSNQINVGLSYSMSLILNFEYFICLYTCAHPSSVARQLLMSEK